MSLTLDLFAAFFFHRDDNKKNCEAKLETGENFLTKDPFEEIGRARAFEASTSRRESLTGEPALDDVRGAPPVRPDRAVGMMFAKTGEKLANFCSNMMKK
jgi:hypothetical protein